MNGLLDWLATAGNLSLVIVGFGLIIFLHELGHFLAARWAGIRVLAFAIGFGPAIASYRKGLGWRWGSSEKEMAPASDLPRGDGRQAPGPTEYRLNVLPLGGYVKMLGQEDLNPGATSAASDSYQNTPPWKRMVVISAGVVMNIISAAILFVVVYTVGISTEPAVVGGVAPGSPASQAVAINADQTPVQAAGLLPGDRIVRINGNKARSFNDLVLAVAMTAPGARVHLEVQRDPLDRPLHFEIRPEPGELSGLLEIGVEPARSTTIMEPPGPVAAEQMRAVLAGRGIERVAPGMQLVEVAGRPAAAPQDIRDAVRRSGGEPVEVAFEAPGGERIVESLLPLAEMQLGFIPSEQPGARVAVDHLLGLRALMKVRTATEEGAAKGLRDGDVFLRVGRVEFPSLEQGMREIQRHAGRDIPITLLRREGGEPVDLQVAVTGGRAPRIGFLAGDTAEDAAVIAAPVELVYPTVDAAEPVPTPAGAANLQPGSRIVRVGDEPVATFVDIRETLRRLTTRAAEAGQSAEIPLRVELPLATADGLPIEEDAVLALTRRDVADLHKLSWISPLSAGLFEPEQILLRGGDPLEAMGLGLHETRRVMLTTYLTFARLFQGTVKVEHLKGPVGIAHLGTRIAERGFIWLLFFMALVSVNLAVINFLPLPIVDGGQFLMIVYEQIRGRPVPIGVQNGLTLAGLALIGLVFLVVTYNDIMGLVGGG